MAVPLRTPLHRPHVSGLGSSGMGVWVDGVWVWVWVWGVVEVEVEVETGGHRPLHFIIYFQII